MLITPNTGVTPVPETTRVAKDCWRWIKAGGQNRSDWLPRSSGSYALCGSPCWRSCIPTRSVGTRSYSVFLWLPRSSGSYALRGSPCWHSCIPTRSMGMRSYSVFLWLPRSSGSYALRGSPCWRSCIPTRSMGTRSHSAFTSGSHALRGSPLGEGLACYRTGQSTPFR